MSGEHHGDGQASDSGRHHASHRASTAATWARVAFAAIALLLSLAAPVAAGPFEDAVAASDRGDYATALRLWHSLAKQGGAYAQISLGIMYNRGRGVPQDYVEAVKWFRLAADQGLDTAQYVSCTPMVTGCRRITSVRTCGSTCQPRRASKLLRNLEMTFQNS
jgi:TPR repeat protein